MALSCIVRFYLISMYGSLQGRGSLILKVASLDTNVNSWLHLLTLVLLDPDIYGFKHILSQIICH